MDTTFLQQYYEETQEALKLLANAHESLMSVSQSFSQDYSLIPSWPTEKTPTIFFASIQPVVESLGKHQDAIKHIGNLISEHRRLHQLEYDKIVMYKAAEDMKKDIEQKEREQEAAEELRRRRREEAEERQRQEEERKREEQYEREAEAVRIQEQNRQQLNKEFQENLNAAEKYGITIEEYSRYKKDFSFLTIENYRARLLEANALEQSILEKRQRKRKDLEEKLDKEVPLEPVNKPLKKPFKQTTEKKSQFVAKDRSYCKSMIEKFDHPPETYDKFSTRCQMNLHTRSCNCCLSYFNYLCKYFNVEISLDLEQNPSQMNKAMRELQKLVHPDKCGDSSSDIFLWLQAQINSCEQCRSGIFTG